MKLKKEFYGQNIYIAILFDAELDFLSIIMCLFGTVNTNYYPFFNVDVPPTLKNNHYKKNSK